MLVPFKLEATPVRYVVILELGSRYAYLSDTLTVRVFDNNSNMHVLHWSPPFLHL